MGWPLVGGTWGEGGKVQTRGIGLLLRPGSLLQATGACSVSVVPSVVWAE